MYNMYVIYNQDVDVRTATRVSNACKYVLMLLVIVVIVLATGMLLHSPSGERKDWKKSVLDSENKGDAAITFLVSVLTLIGFSFFISYGAIGLAVMPIDMIFGKRVWNVLECSRFTTGTRRSRGHIYSGN